MTIAPTEMLLTGQWLVLEGRVVADETCTRIDELTRSYLKGLGRDASGWDALYQDPGDRRLWELTYPESHMHGGGPPQLRCMTLEEATKKYGSAVSCSPPVS